MKRTWRTLAVVVALGMGGCDLFGPSGPGVLDATLTATEPLGAVVLELTGVGIEGFESQGQTRAFGAEVDAAAGRHRVILVSPDGAAMRFGIRVLDVGGDSPLVTVVSAASLDNQPALATGVEVRVERP